MVSTFNLRQISLALNLYLDDFGKRPPAIDDLLGGKYLTESRSLLCPEDKTGNWGKLVQAGSMNSVTAPLAGPDSPAPVGSPIRYSYLLHPLSWDEWTWNRLMQEGGAMMVKLESGGQQTEIVEFLASHDIAVCAHVGLKPQSVHKTGGFRVQGRERETAARLLEEARRLESAGADIVLLECIPATLGKAITAALHVPVIGIGAGPDTDGQILVTYDMLDITTGRKPRFVRNFMDGARGNLEALQHYVRAVKQGEYPAPEHCF